VRYENVQSISFHETKAITHKRVITVTAVYAQAIAIKVRKRNQLLYPSPNATRFEGIEPSISSFEYPIKLRNFFPIDISSDFSAEYPKSERSFFPKAKITA